MAHLLGALAPHALRASASAPGIAGTPPAPAGTSHLAGAPADLASGALLGLGDTVQSALLLLVVLGPLVGAVAALLPAPPGLRGRGPEQAVLRHGVTVSAVILVAALLLALGFDRGRAAHIQASTDVSWIAAYDIRFHLGVDGISLPLLVLTALLTFLCALHSYFRPPKGGTPRAFVALLLLLEGGALAAFAVLDLVLFFVAFETVLIPMYFLIARWGGAKREQAAWKFILFTLVGSAVMLLGLLLIGLRAGTFDMVALATDNGSGLSKSVQVTAVLAIGLGLAVKSPMWPLHSWLPAAHTAAPTAGSVMLAGVLLKMGTYGFVRVAIPVAPEGMKVFAPWLAVLAAAGILWGSLACLQLVRRGSGGDLKRLVAYSSVGHMGFVLLGIASMTPQGLNGALFANIAHGLITGLLFFLVGGVKDRAGTSVLDRLSGSAGAALYGRAPRYAVLLAFAAVASLGLPGLAGFWGEMLTMYGAFDPASGLPRATYLTCMAVAGFGTLLTAAYLLLVVRRLCMGPAPLRDNSLLPVNSPLGEDPGPAHAEKAAPATAPVPARGADEPAPLLLDTPPTPAAPYEPPALAERPFPELSAPEAVAWTPLVALTVLAGLWPALLIGLSDPAVHKLLTGGAA
ncbi:MULTISPECIES: complex I subunit 4 family protein [Streptomyces]|uniref:NADH-quinone oxidoreductase subunit M n=1 Tax=Streptomyces evansiae TaxID=3075535 RepID=A0ABD5E2L2_9ACTN|nr:MULTISPECIES: NADH-quinone oxidoreductase subunit M [unclassified Streptomyces]ASY33303.1 NADH-quinone oxidoreductase subunit M [Streptomyces sp. CLI2509]MDT0415313.1 NADH-quinone oxidoreductase subunit M [Streptomyces sp. DSM 41982]SCD89341.1 NADH-quinone oxidoreductase subunit M [Streptomyces sp. SolWspMP-sol7th]